MVLAAAHACALGGAVSKDLQALLARPENDIALGRGALLVCKEEYPELDVQAQLALLDASARRLSAELARAKDVMSKLEALRTFLFDTEKYELPKEDRPSDFLLCDVLKLKRGNCLGLSVLCLALAERTGLKLYGVPLPARTAGPGHLLVRYDDGAKRQNFDPVERGAAHPDEHYRKLFKLPADEKRLAAASRKEVLSILLANLGGARVEAGRPAAALPLLEQAIALSPGLASAQNNVGAAHLCLGNAAAAEKAYQKALTLLPGMAGARLGLADIALRQGDSASAEKQIKAVMAEEPENVQAKCLLASVQLARGEPGAAAGLLRGAAIAAPKDVLVRCNLGKAHFVAGNFLEAEQAYREALTLDANCADAHSGLGSVLRATGQTQESQTEFAAASG